MTAAAPQDPFAKIEQDSQKEDWVAALATIRQLNAGGPNQTPLSAPDRAKLLTLVTGVIYRSPGLLAKAVTTLDVLSGGRAMLGIGAAWNEQESAALGIPFPPVA